MADCARNPQGRKSDSGVTLIEILVVLALIGVSAAIVSYALPSSARARTLDQEAALFAARLNLAAERSLIGGRHFQVIWQAQDYRFEEWQDGAWHTAAGAPLSDTHALDRGATLSDASGAQNGTIRITPALLPSSNGLTTLRLDAGPQQRSISFDGAAAHVMQARP